MPSPESSRLNLAKANARRPPGTPRPWRSEQESRVIRRRAWHWFTSDRGATCPARRLARLLGVSHTWIQKLIREFETDPSKILREVRTYGPATLDDLRRAQEETVRDRQRGWLRSSAQKPSDLAAKPRYFQHEEKSDWELEAARESRFVEYLRSRPRSPRPRRSPRMTRRRRS
jgi:hypothetical protein